MSGLPRGWVETSLGALCSPPQYGWTTSARHGGVRSLRFLRTTDITHGAVDWGTVPFCAEEPADPSRYALASGDIVISRAGSVGFSCRLSDVQPSVFASYLIRFRPSHEVDGRYVSYFLKSEAYWRQVRAATSGITLANVNAKKLAAVRLPLAPRSEQERIVAAIEEQFSRIDTGVAAVDSTLRKLRVFRSALLWAAVTGRLVPQHEDEGSGRDLLVEIEKTHQALRSTSQRGQFVTAMPTLPARWAAAPWSAIGHSQNGRAFPSSDYSGYGTRLLRPGNLGSSGDVVWTNENTRRMPAHYASDYSDYLVGLGEIVMNLTAQSLKDEFLGRVCMTVDAAPALLNQRIARLTPTGMNRRFVFLVLQSKIFRRFVDQLNTGSLIQHMFTWQLDQFLFPIPPRREQDRIVAEFDSHLTVLDALRRSVHDAGIRARVLRSSVLAAAFAGAIVPQDPADVPAHILLDRIAADRTGSSGRVKTAVRNSRPRRQQAGA